MTPGAHDDHDRWRAAPDHARLDAALTMILSAPKSASPLPDLPTRLVIESVAAEHYATSPVRRSKRRPLDVIHALDLDERAVQWFFDRRDWKQYQRTPGLAQGSRDTAPLPTH